MPEECSPPVRVFLATWVLVWGRNDGAESCKVLTGTCM